MRHPAPRIEEHGGVLVVRDDLIPGGTKARVLPLLLNGGIGEYVYASPAQGYAQVALAYTCREAGARAVVFTARRKIPHARTLEAKAAGAKIVMVPTGYLSNVQAKARAYCAASGASLIPFGLDVAPILEGIAQVAIDMGIAPREVWTVAGSGTLSRALQRAWPEAKFYAVQVGREPKAGRASVMVAPETFDQNAKLPPPFPSCSNYDAKAWRFICRHASAGSLFWNVAA